MPFKSENPTLNPLNDFVTMKRCYRIIIFLMPISFFWFPDAQNNKFPHPL